MVVPNVSWFSHGQNFATYPMFRLFGKIIQRGSSLGTFIREIKSMQSFFTKVHLLYSQL